MSDEKPSFLQPMAYSLAIGIMIGWLLYIGQTILIPVVIGIISVYVLTESANRLAKVFPFNHLSDLVRQILVLMAFLLFLFILISFVVVNAQAIRVAIPGYSENLTALSDQIEGLLGLSQSPNWSSIEDFIVGKIDIGSFIGFAASSLSSFGAMVLTAVLYAVFLLADLKGLPEKTIKALGDQATADHTLKVVREVNTRIGGYLMAKTMVNIILALISLVVMLVLGIEFAIFWAILIGLLNYIPYVGSVIGVLFPVTLTLVQFGSIWDALLAFGALMVAQSYVGYILEPRVLGRSVNLSPFVVLLALAVWSVLWGAPGAILAVPLTAMVMIILAVIPATRPIAVMMSEDGNV